MEGRAASLSHPSYFSAARPQNAENWEPAGAHGAHVAAARGPPVGSACAWPPRPSFLGSCAAPRQRPTGPQRALQEPPLGDADAPRGHRRGPAGPRRGRVGAAPATFCLLPWGREAPKRSEIPTCWGGGACRRCWRPRVRRASSTGGLSPRPSPWGRAEVTQSWGPQEPRGPRGPPPRGARQPPGGAAGAPAGPRTGPMRQRGLK